MISSKGNLLRRATRILLALATVRVSADCECGYSAKIAGGDRVAVFTDLTEVDFTTVDDISDNSDWRRQEFTISDEAARGEYGESFEVDNVETYIEGDDDGLAVDGVDYGLQFLVNSEVEDDMVIVGELDSTRSDIFYGSFRTSMKLSTQTGTCAAFFWYFNDTQEIDMEFLNREFNRDNGTFPVNLVLHSSESADYGYDASETGNFITANLPFDPAEGFHEYRFDYLDDAVVFYADGEVLGEISGDAIPTSPGLLILQHWSNGNPLWSGGPPEEDAILTVSYVKAYFNSTDEDRQDEFADRCTDPTAANAVCEIPDVADDSSASAFFFAAQENMTNGQILSWSGAGGLWGAHLSVTTVWAMSLIACLWLL